MRTMVIALACLFGALVVAGIVCFAVAGCYVNVEEIKKSEGTSMYCVKGVSEKTLAWKLILAKAPIARTYSAARWGSGEHCSPDGGWGNAPVLL